MTKLLCALGLLLLSCGVVEAQEDDRFLWLGNDGNILVQRENGAITTCNEALTQCLTPKTCEQKMKEAMKAVDGYLPNRDVLTGSTLEYCDDVCAAERALDAAKKQAVAMAKWRAVYKECVK